MIEDFVVVVVVGMGKDLVEAPAKGGFSFDLCVRNEMLAKKGLRPPTTRKTGTTIVGLIFKVTPQQPTPTTKPTFFFLGILN